MLSIILNLLIKIKKIKKLKENLILTQTDRPCPVLTFAVTNHFFSMTS